MILCFSIDLFYRGVHFNILTSPSDFLRYIVSCKLDLQEHIKTFDEIYSKLKTKYVEEGIKRENYLEARREELSRVLALDQ